MRKALLLPLGIAAALGFGCAEERALEPPPVAKLPAMNVSDNPITATSQKYCAWENSYGPESELAISIPSSVLTAMRSDDDVYLTYSTPDGCPAEVFVLEPRRGRWHQAARGLTQGVCIGQTQHCWLLSMLGSRVAGSFLDARGRLRIRGGPFEEPCVRVLRYRHDYRFVTISGSGYGCTLACDGRTIWVSYTPFPHSDTVRGDTVIVMDFAASRLRAFQVPGRHIYAMAWSDQELWVLDGSQPMTFSRMDSTGVLRPAFTWPRHQSDFAPAMTWL